MMYILPIVLIVAILRNGIEHVSPFGWTAIVLLILSTTYTHLMTRQSRHDRKGK